MFTGIIQAVGQVAALERRGGDVRLRIGGLPLADGQLGESIAVSGVCLTAVTFTDDGFVADVSGETLACTTLGGWLVGERVNLERALALGERLGGHIVSGHVDGVGEVVARRADARSQRFTLRAPAALARYIAAKGSITLDGVSLTVNAVEGPQFEVNIVPHTLTHTSLDAWQPGRRVNIEVDVLARYLERLMGRDAGGVDLDLLAEHGFVNR
ncbi:riboflavin synthase [Immundisolibacter sp.]|uniref:riboflavin synthase n=1 Tax=Immundisolibacter sp. TaxID=1934948 RepID=UPI003564A0BC